LLFRKPAVEGKEIVIVGTSISKLYLGESRILEALLKEGYGIALVDLWGGGENNLLFSATNDSYYSRSLIWLGKCIQGKWIEDFRMIEKFLQDRFGAAVKLGAGGIGDAAVAAALFAAARCEDTPLWLEKAPETLCYDKAKETKFSHTVIVPGILQFGDMADFCALAGGNVTSF